MLRGSCRMNRCKSTPNSRTRNGKQVKAVNNNTRGTIAQNRVMSRYRRDGYTVVRQGARDMGGDFFAFKKHGLTYIVEVKVNNAVLTAKQKKAKKTYGKHFRIERVNMPTKTTCKRGNRK